ncbi:MAG: ATP-binding protein [Potamolinea sp.]
MNLTHIVREVIQSLTTPTHIQVKIVRELPTFLCDPIQMRQVFQNLISNAIKYMDKPQGEVKINYTDNGEHYQFCVADNGMGIESKYFDHIFQLFQTIASRDQVDSTGVGLSTVKKIVELNGGKIWVESKLEQGSTFFFRLPK